MLSRDGRKVWLPSWDPSDGFTPMVTQPTPSNTGVPAGMSLSMQSGDQTISSTQMITGVEFRGQVTVAANDVVFRFCRFSGGTPPAPDALASSTYPLVDAKNPAYSGTLFSQCSFIPTTPQVNVYGLIATNTTTHRCYVGGGVTDCLNWQTDVNNQNAGGCTSVGDYLAPTWYAYDPKQTDGAHADCIQIANGRGHRCIGTQFRAVTGKNQCIAATPYAVGAIGGLDFLGCWFAGGYSQISCWPKASFDKSYYIPNVRIIGCRFDSTGVNTELGGGKNNPFNVLVTPETLKGSDIRDNILTVPAAAPSPSTVYVKVAPNP